MNGSLSSGFTGLADEPALKRARIISFVFHCIAAELLVFACSQYRSDAAEPSNKLAQVHAYLADGTPRLPKPMTNEAQQVVFNPGRTLQRIPGREDELDAMVREFTNGAPRTEATMNLFATNRLWKASWNPYDTKGDGIRQFKKELVLSAFKLTSPKPPAAAKLYSAAIFIECTDLVRILEQEKTVSMYSDEHFKHAWRDGDTVASIDHDRFLVSTDHSPKSRLWFQMRMLGKPKRGSNVVLLLHFRQTLRNDGVLVSESYSTSEIADYYAVRDELHPVRDPNGNLLGYLVASRLAVQLKHPDDDDKARERQMRQALGNWKRFVEYFGLQSSGRKTGRQ